MNKEKIGTTEVLEDIIKKARKTGKIDRRNFLRFLTAGGVSILLTELGIKILEEPKLPNIPKEGNNEEVIHNDERTLPRITQAENVKYIIDEINFVPHGESVIKAKYDRITSEISGMRVVSLEERDFLRDPTIQYRERDLRLTKMSKEEYRIQLKNPRYENDNQGIQYITDIINSILRSEFIPDGLKMNEFLQILKSNPSIFQRVEGFFQFSSEFSYNINNYGYIVIQNGKVKFIYGVKSKDFQGSLPVSSEVGADSIIDPFTRRNMEQLNNDETQFYRINLRR